MCIYIYIFIYLYILEVHIAPYLKTRKVFLSHQRKKERKGRYFFFFLGKEKEGIFKVKAKKKVDFGPNQMRKGYASKRKDDDQESRSRNGEAQPKLSLQ